MTESATHNHELVSFRDQCRANWHFREPLGHQRALADLEVDAGQSAAGVTASEVAQTAPTKTAAFKRR